MDPDCRLPFFTYGLFKRGELGWLCIRDCVERLETTAVVKGKLLERDGLVILDPHGPGSTTGMIVFFHRRLASQAYAAVDELELDHQYSWSVLEVRHAQTTSRANALVGKSPRKGSKLLESQWSLHTDPLFTHGLKVVDQLVEDSFSSSGMTSFFRLHAAYLLLWSAIERYAAFRYGLSGGAINQKLRAVAEEPAFGAALATHASRSDRIYRSDRPSDHVTLDPIYPKGSMMYYYQLRSNVAHRGKGAVEDLQRLRDSSIELSLVFQDVLKAALDDASRV